MNTELLNMIEYAKTEWENATANNLQVVQAKERLSNILINYLDDIIAALKPSVSTADTPDGTVLTGDAGDNAVGSTTVGSTAGITAGIKKRKGGYSDGLR